MAYETVESTAQAVTQIQGNSNISTATQAQIISEIAAPGSTTVAAGFFSNSTGLQQPNPLIQNGYVVAGGGGTVVGTPGTFNSNILITNQGTTLNFDGRTPEPVAQDQQQAHSDSGYIVVGADGNDTILGGHLADNMTGAQGNDTIATYAGNDTIVSGIGIDTVDGGTGFDVVQVAGTNTGWTATKATGEVTLVSTTNANNVSHLKNVDFISFTDATGLQRSIVVSGTEAEGNAMRLYQGIFNRSADQGGAEYWEAQVRTGATTNAIANQFLISNEYKLAHPTQTDTQFVEMLYQQALGRKADDGGLNYWVGELNQGASQAAVAVGIIDSQEGVTHINNVIVLIGTV